MKAKFSQFQSRRESGAIKPRVALISASSSRCSRLRSRRNWPITRIIARVKLIMLGRHLIKVSSRKNSVRPPKIRVMTNTVRCMRSTLRQMTSPRVTCRVQATMMPQVKYRPKNTTTGR